MGIGWTEILLILVVALIVLGPSRLPGAARTLGRALRDFRSSLSGLNEPDTDFTDRDHPTVKEKQETSPGDGKAD